MEQAEGSACLEPRANINNDARIMMNVELWTWLRTCAMANVRSGEYARGGRGLVVSESRLGKVEMCERACGGGGGW